MHTNLYSYPSVLFKRFLFSRATAAPKRRLILVSLDWTRSKDPPLSLGHASILANVEKHGVETLPRSWSVNHAGFRAQDVAEHILEHATPDTDVALGVFIWNEHATQSILNTLKREKFPGRIILGGPQVSYTKQGLESFYPQADVFVRGYAETAIAKLMSSPEPRPDLRGVHYAGTPDRGTAASVTSLDDLPSPYLTGLIAPQSFIRLETQRGCPFECSFCQHRDPDVGTRKRLHHDIGRTMREVEWITSNKVINDVAVLDPTFNSGPHYLKVMDKFIEGGYAGKLSLQCRAEMIKDEFLDRVSALNRTGRVVLEFGLQTVVPKEFKAISRPNNMVAVQRTLDALNRRKIECEISVIFGLPHQTLRSFKQSVSFCIIANKVPVVHAFPLMLLRGTPLHEQKREFGLVESNEIASDAIDRVQDNIPHVVASDSFSYPDWRQMAKIASELENSYNKTGEIPPGIIENDF
jgi:radical SAM superfamily enzyme